MAKLSSKGIKIIKTFNLYCCFLVVGLITAIPGPTLIDLVNNVNTDMKHIAYIYIARSIGELCGSLIGGVILDMTKKKQLVLTIFNFLTSFTTLGIPLSTGIISLTGWMTANGFAMGFIDIGTNVCCLNLWGEESAPYYQALHFIYSLGGLLAPLLAAPFLGNYTETAWNNDSTLNLTHTDNLTATGNFTESLYNPSLIYPYGVISVFGFLVTILFFAMCILSPNDEVTVNDDKTSNVESRGLKFTITLITFTFILIFMTMGTEMGQAQLLTAYAVKGPLQLTASTGSYVTSAFWAAFTVTRVFAIFLTAKFGNEALLSFNVIFTCIGSVMLSVLAVRYEWGFWLSAIFLGIGTSSFFPAAVNWADTYITVTNKLLALFTVSVDTAGIFIPYIISYYIEEHPEVFVYINQGTVAAAATITVVMYLILRKIPTKYIALKKVTVSKNNSDVNMNGMANK